MVTAIKSTNKKTTSKKTATKTEPSTKKKSLTPKQSEYLKGRASGKSKKKSALDAGYSEATAENAKSVIENNISENIGYMELLDTYIPQEKILKRIASHIDDPDTSVSLSAIDKANKMRGNYINRLNITAKDDDINLLTEILGGSKDI